MRVDIIVAGGAIEEGLALLPVHTCVLEGCAGGIDVGLRQRAGGTLGVEVLASLVECGGGCLQVAVGGVHHVVDILSDNGLQGGALYLHGLFLTVVVTA